MKKSVILTILAIYVMAIVAVGLLGIQMAVYDEIKYVTAIRLVDSKDGAYKVEISKSDPSVDFIRLDYVSGLRFQLCYEIDPIDASNKTVRFDFDTEGYEDCIEISSDGIVTVKANKTVIIDGFIRAEDGSKIRSRKIRIYIRQS